jgi:hypothetical protein
MPSRKIIFQPSAPPKRATPQLLTDLTDWLVLRGFGNYKLKFSTSIFETWLRQ